MSETVLVTGATGFLGSFIVEELVQRPDVEVRVLVRARAGRSLYQRLEALWWDRPLLRGQLGKRILPVEGDITAVRLGMDAGSFDALARDVSSVVHAAAEVGINQTWERFLDVNVRGTDNVLQFAGEVAQHGCFRRFVYVSTAYVAGSREGDIAEELFADGSFNSLYEQSKHEAELLVSSYGDEVPFAIMRPSQIVGHSETGFVTTFNTLYYPLKLYMRGDLGIVPAARDLRINMVPVDYVARLAVEALFDERALGKVVHAVTPSEEQPTLGELVDFVRSWTKREMNVDLPKAVYVPLSGMTMLGRARNLRRGDTPKRKGAMSNMMALAPYFQENRRFETKRAQAVCQKGVPHWQAYLPRLLAYAVRRGFFNYTDRTVYEQMLERLKPNARTKLEYFDVTAEGVVKCETSEVRGEIHAVCCALGAAGIGPGDRVATIGVNSVRYFAVDAALGTPVILENSGIGTSPTLFVDPVLCVAAPWEGAALDRQLPMPFVSEQPDYILSPYFDWLSFYFNKRWRVPSGDIMSIMIKMADDSVGSFDGRTLDKPLTDRDWEVIAKAVDTSLEILEAVGAEADKAFFGTLNAGHPGGCLPLTAAEAETLHHDILPPNLFVADASLFPRSMGNPPILTIMALSKRIARLAALS